VSREHLGWVLRESGPESADHTVLLLPGALCTAAFYDDLLAEPSMSKTSIRFVATTIPGFGGTAPPKDMSMESYAKLAGKLASDLRCDAVVGHSLGANIAVETASAGEFSGPLVLLSPSFSRRDESRFPRALDRLSRVLGHLPYSLMLKIIGPAMKSGLPQNRSEALIAELKKNDPHFVRQQTHLYLEYLDRHGSLAPRFADSGVPAWVVYGENNDVGITDDERDVLEASPHVSIVRISDAGHFTLNQQPGEVARLVLEALTSRAPR
jgi:pimeloyl-ACP methyl ester carboxylesterase